MSIVRHRRYLCSGLLLVSLSSAGGAQAEPTSSPSAPNGTRCDFAAPAARTEAQWHAYEVHRRSRLHRRYDANCDGTIDAEELAKYQREINRSIPVLVARQGIRGSAGSPPRGSTDLGPPGSRPFANEATNSSKGACPEGVTLSPIVRDSYNDLYLVPSDSCPPDASKASGAQLGFARDDIAKNTQWSLKGVAGARVMLVQRGTDIISPYLNMAAIAPIVRFQRVSNSNAKLKSQEVDVFSPGISSEFLFDQLGDGKLQLYARARVNGNGNFQGDFNSASVTGELQPVYDPLSIGTNIPIGYGYLWFSPVARIQYFNRLDRSRALPLFALGDEVLRMGSGVSVNIVPLQGDPVPAWAQKFVLSFSYDWHKDLYSRQDFKHYLVSLTYNITDNIGIAAKYENGNIEETGRRIDLTTLGLTIKY